MTPKSAKDPSIEEVTHVSLCQALDEFERLTIQAREDGVIAWYSYVVYTYLASELNKIADYIIEKISESRKL